MASQLATHSVAPGRFIARPASPPQVVAMQPFAYHVFSRRVATVPAQLSVAPRQRVPPVQAGGPLGNFLSKLADLQHNLELIPGDMSDAEITAQEEGDQEEGTFRPLDPQSTGSVDGSSEQAFGPLAVLAVGLPADEHALLRALLDGMGADDVRLVPCTPSMLQGSLGAALDVDPLPAHQPPPLRLPRVLFLSGMYAAELVEVVGAVRESGLPEMACAAAVPKSWHRNLEELVGDVSADHAAMMLRRAEAQLAAARAGQDGADERQ